jgi:hypothetical protein
VTVTGADRVQAAQLAAAPRRSVAPYFVFLVLVGATIPWQRKSYFEGGLDPVVLAKAVLSLFALGCGVLVAFGRRTREVRASPLIFLLLYLMCSTMGAWSTGDLIPSLVIVVRVLLLATTVIVLSRVFDGPFLLGSLIAALATFAVVAAVTGIPKIAEVGRLAGGLLYMHPNELASTCAVVMLWCLWKISAGQDTWWHLAALALAFGVMVATASRTPWLAIGVAALWLVFHVRAIQMRTLIVGLAALPVAWWVVSGTEVVRSLLLRGEDSSSLTTLSNRTIAWQAALGPKSSPWLTWFGGGLQLKRINVPGQYWNQQILDSSWISALVQGGFVGLAICGAWVLFSMFCTIRSPARLRALQLALLAYLSIRGVLESGLFDASTAFLLFFTAVMATPLRTASPPEVRATASDRSAAEARLWGQTARSS